MFSLAPREALRKIREFNFADPNHWILALIQGCHACRNSPRRIEISGRRDKVVVRVRDFPTDILKELGESVSSLSRLDSSLEPFRRAVWGLLNYARFRVFHRDTLLSWDGEELTQGDCHEGDDLRWEVVFSPDAAWEERHAARARNFLNIAQVVQDRAWFARIPIFVDGQPLGRHPAPGGTSMYSPLVLAEGLYGEDTGKLFRTEWNEARLRYSKPLFTYHHGASGEFLGFFCLVERDAPSRFRFEVGPSQMNLVKHGVIIHEETLGRGKVFFRAVSVDDETETDMTGLAARTSSSETLFTKAKLKKKAIAHTWSKMSATLKASGLLFEGLNVISTLREAPEQRETSSQQVVAGLPALAAILCVLSPKLLLAMPLVVGASAWFLLAKNHGPVSNLGTELRLAIEETPSFFVL